MPGDSVSTPLRSRFACTSCDYRATKPSHLRRHAATKHGDKSMDQLLSLSSLSCKQCDFVANHRASLRLHVRTKHEGVRFPCDHCDYKATQKGSLKIHMQAYHRAKLFHRGAREEKLNEKVPQKCDFCDFITTKSSLLITHLQGHVNFCEICEYVGISRKQLNKHIKREHMEEEEGRDVGREVEEEGVMAPMVCGWCGWYRPLGATDCGPPLAGLGGQVEVGGPCATRYNMVTVRGAEVAFTDMFGRVTREVEVALEDW